MIICYECDSCRIKAECDMVDDYSDSSNVNVHKMLVKIYNKGRADAIDECKEAFNEHLFDSPMINPIMTRNEILLFLDQLKEQK